MNTVGSNKALSTALVDQRGFKRIDTDMGAVF